MSKYIDRSKVNDEIVRVLEHTDCNDKYIDDVLRAIEKLPTIVVSEDCISREYIKTLFENNLTGTCKDVVVHTIANAPSIDDDFCSYGERKEE